MYTENLEQIASADDIVSNVCELYRLWRINWTGCIFHHM